MSFGKRARLPAGAGGGCGEREMRLLGGLPGFEAERQGGAQRSPHVRPLGLRPHRTTEAAAAALWLVGSPDQKRPKRQHIKIRRHPRTQQDGNKAHLASDGDCRPVGRYRHARLSGVLADIAGRTPGPKIPHPEAGWQVWRWRPAEHGPGACPPRSFAASCAEEDLRGCSLSPSSTSPFLSGFCYVWRLLTRTNYTC